jgi:hypothetical protein
MKALESRTQDLLTEIKNLKHVVEVLETENARLRQHLILMYKQDRNEVGSGVSPNKITVTPRQLVTSERRLPTTSTQPLPICRLNVTTVPTIGITH